jgi:hypothetical protein
MAGPRQLACALLLISLTGCGTAARPPVTRKEAPPQPPAPAEATPTPPSTEAPPQPSSSQKTVDVVDPGGESSPPSLVQAAKAERERRAHAGEPVAVITDKTLPHLPKGQLTYAAPKKKAAGPEAPSTAQNTARDEQYWRGRALEIRTRWKKTDDEVKELEQSAAGWRRRFYAENDPYARDSQVKPEWDRVLDRLGKARSEVEATRKELDDFMEEGRRAGALPGWLREGAEQEPARDEKKDKGPGTLEPKEPSIYQQPPPPGAMR